jgi:hypothetical protein
MMSWTWRTETADGELVAADVPEFSAQGDAETWLGEHYGELVDVGVEQVSLLHDGRLAYGPMSLSPEA